MRLASKSKAAFLSMFLAAGTPKDFAVFSRDDLSSGAMTICFSLAPPSSGGGLAPRDLRCRQSTTSCFSWGMLKPPLSTAKLSTNASSIACSTESTGGGLKGKVASLVACGDP